MNLLRSVFILTFTVASISIAQAHAFLDHASPRVGSTVTAPDHVQLWMTEELEPAFSKVQVFDSEKHQLDKKDDKISGSTMTVSLPKLAAGTYLVKWTAVATDTHHTNGTFNFTVQ